LNRVIRRRIHAAEHGAQSAPRCEEKNSKSIAGSGMCRLTVSQTLYPGRSDEVSRRFPVSLLIEPRIAGGSLLESSDAERIHIGTLLYEAEF